jgi:hypothetical protein
MTFHQYMALTLCVWIFAGLWAVIGAFIGAFE